MYEDMALEGALKFFKSATEKQIINYNSSEWDAKAEFLFGGGRSMMNYQVLSYLKQLCMRKRMTIRVEKINSVFVVSDDFENTDSWRNEFPTLKSAKDAFYEKGFRWIVLRDKEGNWSKYVKLINKLDKDKDLFENSKL